MLLNEIADFSLFLIYKSVHLVWSNSCSVQRGAHSCLVVALPQPLKLLPPDCFLLPCHVLQSPDLLSVLGPSYLSAFTAHHSPDAGFFTHHVFSPVASPAISLIDDSPVSHPVDHVLKSSATTHSVWCCDISLSKASARVASSQD